jgi:hypothetical protein
MAEATNRKFRLKRGTGSPLTETCIRVVEIAEHLKGHVDLKLKEIIDRMQEIAYTVGKE